MKIPFLIPLTFIGFTSFGQSLQGKWMSTDSTAQLDFKRKRIAFKMSYKNGIRIVKPLDTN